MSRRSSHPTLKDIEYEQIMISLRHFEEYRLKIFSFFVAINGALLSVVASQSIGNIPELYIYIFAFTVTSLGFLAETRTVRVADQYRRSAVKLCHELGFNELEQIHQSVVDRISGSGFILRYAFYAFYTLVLLIWCLLTVTLIVGP